MLRHMCVPMHVCIVCAPVSVHVHMYMCACVFACVSVCTCAYVQGDGMGTRETVLSLGKLEPCTFGRAHG